MIYGYARCSTDETRQDVKRQERELKEMGVDVSHIFCEYESGTKRDRRELGRLLDTVKNGDTIIATELSRITRSTKDLIEIIEIAKEKHLKLVLGSFEADCSGESLDPMTEGMLKMMGVFAELERNLISERVKSGMKNAAAKGRKIGRPNTTLDDIPSRFMKSYPLYEKRKINQSELARLTELSRNSVRKYIKLMEEEKDSLRMENQRV